MVDRLDTGPDDECAGPRALRDLLPRPSDHGSGPLFLGDVRSRALRQASLEGGLTAMTTAFAAGAGTVWHAHDSDQVLVVIEGRGGLEDDRHGHRELVAGDLVVVRSGLFHRHLAATDESMTHLSITTLGDHHIDPDRRST